MFFQNEYTYYIIGGLQAICIFHAYRNGKFERYIWMLLFLPVIGSIIYLYQEVWGNRRVSAPKVDVASVFNPGVKLKRLEEEVRFTDTFANRIRLADAYLEAGQTDKAVDIYNASLTGAFAENEHVLAQLIIAYYKQQRYAEVTPIAKKLYKTPQFPRSQAHITYAMALEQLGQLDAAETEFKAMKGRYSYFEQRYQYGLFLIRQDRIENAEQIFTDMLDEQPHLSAMEKKASKEWFVKAKAELKNIYQ
ncbi:tetratricopeptide repeat protein [Mucilaginibacter pedocola]|uniref:Cardiolipin synthase N-terminal domain-containing protein n=1 Tax=Mucilaginibacter pedocola TaxID=1792845 RepID=A0A1S9PGG1_9SPHI|nr:tetratricopeptide repeat protein [Mucilaginibacter pedocola]OOQ60063.1 hypothetical protein BC343_27430 [Mucilaginibacter pedocola]